jgi:uncharacterized protein (DUF2062 family)
MIFRRRARPNLSTRLWSLVSPRKGWRRGFEYLGHRVQRLPDTPHRIALGVACGVFASFTPFFALHIFVALGLGMVLGANPIAAALGTLFSNPLTFPFIASAALGLGHWMIGSGHATAEASLTLTAIFSDLGSFFDSLFVPYLVGGLLPGALVGALFYAVLRPIVALYQTRRRERLVAGARLRLKRRPSAGAVKKNPVPDGLK